MTYDENSDPLPDLAAPDEPACPDLAALFGSRFKIGHDEAYACEHGEHGRFHDPWLLTVECQHGHIYPHDVGPRAASTNSNGPIAKAVAALDCTSVIQDGSDGINATFHVRDFDKVTALMKPRRKRVGRPLTDEQRAKLVEAGAKYRFKPTATGHHGPQTALESPSTPEDVHSPTQPIQSPNLAPLHD